MACLSVATLLLASSMVSALPPTPPKSLLLQRLRNSGGAVAATGQGLGQKSQVSATASASADQASKTEKAKLPQDPSFFNSFSQGESTYDMDGDAGIISQESGWEPTLDSPYGAQGTDPAWFHESPSGGDSVAWQTHFPALQTGLAGRDVTLGKWVQGSGGSWQQEYVPTGNTRLIVSERLRIPAKWFDNSVNQLDGFGRPKLPDAANPARLLGWTEQAVNTTMSCSSPGCTATAALQAFDGKQLKAEACKLNIFVQHYSGKSIESMEVNGATVSSNCQVAANDCNATGARPLYACVLDLNLDKLISQTGVLNISAKLLDDADSSCTYDDNLLLAVPMVTCMVSNLQGPVSNLTNYPAPSNASSLASVGIKLKKPVDTHLRI